MMNEFHEPLVRLTDTPIVLEELLPWLDDPDCGAQGWFHGVTRRKTVISQPATVTGQPQTKTLVTDTLFYEAHRSMALRQLTELAQVAGERFGLTRTVIVHRLGEVPIGQASVVIGCSSPRRRPTMDALPWMMDQLKASVAIWKQERLEDGSNLWVHPVTP